MIADLITYCCSTLQTYYVYNTVLYFPYVLDNASVAKKKTDQRVL